MKLSRRGFLGALLGGVAACALPKPKVKPAARQLPGGTLKVQTVYHMRYGGVVCYYPKSIMYCDGI